MQINPRTKAKDLVKILAEAGKKLSSSTVKRVLHRHGLKGYSASKKPLLQKKHKNGRLQFTNSHWDKDLNFLEKSCGLMKLKWSHLGTNGSFKWTLTLSIPPKQTKANVLERLSQVQLEISVMPLTFRAVLKSSKKSVTMKNYEKLYYYSKTMPTNN